MVNLKTAGYNCINIMSQFLKIYTYMDLIKDEDTYHSSSLWVMESQIIFYFFNFSIFSRFFSSKEILLHISIDRNM